MFRYNFTYEPTITRWDIKLQEVFPMPKVISLKLSLTFLLLLMLAQNGLHISRDKCFWFSLINVIGEWL